MSTLLGSFTAGYLTSRLAHYKVPTLIGVTCASLSAFVLSATLDHLPTPALFLLLSIIGFGPGSFFPLSAVSAQSAAPLKLLGVTVSGLNFVRALGQSMMIALIGTIVLPSGQTACDARIADCAAFGSEGFSLAFAVTGFAFAVTAVLIAFMRAAPLRGST